MADIINELTPEPVTATIRFSDGTELQAEMNGTCFILDNKPSFPADLTIVTVEIDGEVTRYRNAKVQKCASIDGRYWWTLVEESPTVIKFREIDHVEEKHQADIDYLLMLVDEE